MNDAEYLSAAAAVAAMRNGDITAEDYASALLTRTAALKNINAFISLDRDKVLEAARAADRMRASGSLLGALHGLPIPVKDSVNSMDLPSSSGTAAVAPTSSPRVDRGSTSTTRCAPSSSRGRLSPFTTFQRR